MAHGHPSLQKGGGEVAAYSLFELLRKNGHEVIFVGWGGRVSGISPNGILRKVGEADYLLYSETDFFHFSSQSSNLYLALKTLLEFYQPEVVHLHHYIHIGIEVASTVKSLFPNVRVVMTLHEYLAICNNNGQLFTTSGKVCKGYSPESCHRCFPEISPNTFFMRELSIKSAFNFIDHFFTPSKFLKDKYVSWGIPAENISAIENPLNSPNHLISDPLPAPKKGEHWKIGFFGQINFYKGIDIIVEGVRLAIGKRANVELGIHGNLSIVTGESYIDSLKNSINELKKYVRLHGPYEQRNVQKLMRNYHFVIMGSRWYENSPIVIQEAIEANRPLIVPEHGGMLEKAADFGAKYTPSDATSLQNLLSGLSKESYDSFIKKVLIARQDLQQTRNRHLQDTINMYKTPVKFKAVVNINQ
jgi:glycosyltransferase involved in cell wall biosynthesis